MTPEILTFLQPVGKYILASTLLALFYLLFYRGKTSYDLSRKYLVSIALVAILLSQFHIIVRTPPVKIVKVEAALVVPPFSSMTFENRKNAQTSMKDPIVKPVDANITNPVLSKSILPAVISVSQNSQVDYSFKHKLMHFLTIPTILFLIYGLVTLVLIISFILQYFKIIAMKRKGVVRESDGFEIVESADIPTPFSFCKTIFVGQNLTGNKREVVIKHEQWHIRHHHYVDVMVMESLVRLFWFNPVLWWVRKELRNISEFQTDRSVLDEGHELYKYQTIILEEVMEQNPYLANGFNNSFTKKRFIRMKNTIQTRFTLMRRISILPFLLGVFCLLCFTEGQAETRFVMNEKEDPTVIPNDEISDSVFVDSEVVSGILGLDNNSSKIDCKINDMSSLKEDEIEKGILNASTNLGLAIDELEITIKTKNQASRLLSLQKVIELLELKFNEVGFGKNQINEQFCASVTNDDLLKTKTDFIQLKKEMDALKLEKNKQVKTNKFGHLALKMFQTNLVSKLYQAQMSGLSTMLKNMMTPMAKAMQDLSSEMEEEDDKKEASKQQRKSDEEILQKSYLLKSYQSKILDIKTDSQKLLSIQKNKKDTRIRIAMPNINRMAGSWFRLDRNFKIIDKKTKDQYFIRSAEPDIPLNQVINTQSIPNRVIEITLVFPPLKKEVEVVDIVEVYSKDLICPSYGINPCEFKNVNLQDYLLESDEGGNLIN